MTVSRRQFLTGMVGLAGLAMLPPAPLAQAKAGGMGEWEVFIAPNNRLWRVVSFDLNINYCMPDGDPRWTLTIDGLGAAPAWLDSLKGQRVNWWIQRDNCLFDGWGVLGVRPRGRDWQIAIAGDSALGWWGCR